MTQDCWSSATNYVTSRWLADAILRGLKIGLISWKEFHFGIDQDIWNKLQNTHDPLIQKKMSMLHHPSDYFLLVTPPEADLMVKFRCRGVDPWILKEGKPIRLTSVDDKLKQELTNLKQLAARGWPLKLKD